ncbi:hypothetical protein HHK36_002916 [Tetracentron sinense]|uniref:Methyltransferase-like protein 23 n=1 Tax=Tetracentron sinense TaxID=13715 RepID=A0A835DNE8_TETSI|nr:hypothetical protein HHK36_002916 [Tetracentron sinense]
MAELEQHLGFLQYFLLPRERLKRRFEKAQKTRGNAFWVLLTDAWVRTCAKKGAATLHALQNWVPGTDEVGPPRHQPSTAVCELRTARNSTDEIRIISDDNRKELNVSDRHICRVGMARAMNAEDTAVASPAEQHMTMISRHSFGISFDTGDAFSIDIIELGAGTSLPGLVAAKVGSDVTLTDNSNRLEVLDNMSRTCDLNKVKCKILGLTWGEWDAPIFSLHPKFVLGADVLYDTSDFDDLFATVTFLLQNSPGSVFITTYHNRSGHHLIEYLMVKWGLKCTKLLDAFSFMPSCKASSISGNIQLAEIMLNHEQPKCVPDEPVAE